MGPRHSDFEVSRALCREVVYSLLLPEVRYFITPPSITRSSGSTVSP
jgi:hypothetical protein